MSIAPVTELLALSNAYLALCKVPHLSTWRMDNQAAYAGLRDEIARITAQDPEHVQDSYERVANADFRRAN